MGDLGKDAAFIFEAVEIIAGLFVEIELHIFSINHEL